MPTIQDGASNVYSLAYSASPTASLSQRIYYLANAPTGISQLQITPGAKCSIAVLEYSGISKAKPLDIVSTNLESIGTSWASNSITTTTTDLLIGLVSTTGSASAAYASTGNWSTVIDTNNSADGDDTHIQQQVSKAPGSYSASGTSNSLTSESAIISFKADVGLINAFTTTQFSNVAGDDGDYFIEYGSEYMIRNYQRKGTDNTSTIQFTWVGRTTMDTRVSPVYVQIYNVSSASWETLASINTLPADVDFSTTLYQTANPSNYYDSSNTVTFRSYQQVI